MAKFSNAKGGYHVLNDGHSIPRIGLGISRIEGQDEVNKSVAAALAAGYRLFDTAHIYQNERELGVALKKYLPLNGLTRDEVFITTKVPTINECAALSARQNVSNSLELIQTDYLDLVLVHYPRDRDTGSDEDVVLNKKGRKETYAELEKLKEKGLIRSIGVSNYMVYHLLEMKQYAKITPAVNQIEYHPYLTQDHVRQICKNDGVFVQAFSSLCWGNEQVLKEPFIQKMAEKHKVTPQCILYAFALNSGVGIIPKSSNPKRIAENIDTASRVFFSSAEVAELLLLDQNRAFCPRCEPWKCL